MWLYRHRSDGIADALEFQPSLQPDPNRLFQPGLAAQQPQHRYPGAWGPSVVGAAELPLLSFTSSSTIRRSRSVWVTDRWGPAVSGTRSWRHAWRIQQLYQTIASSRQQNGAAAASCSTAAGTLPRPLGVSRRLDLRCVGRRHGGYSHWDGTTWRQVQTGTTVTLFGVWTAGGDLRDWGRRHYPPVERDLGAGGQRDFRDPDGLRIRRPRSGPAGKPAPSCSTRASAGRRSHRQSLRT